MGGGGGREGQVIRQATKTELRQQHNIKPAMARELTRPGASRYGKGTATMGRQQRQGRRMEARKMRLEAGGGGCHRARVAPSRLSPWWKRWRLEGRRWMRWR